MTTHDTSTEQPGTGRDAHHARDGSHCIPQEGPSRLPVGGWIREIATSENWRTTTIVRRHRDRALPVS